VAKHKPSKEPHGLLTAADASSVDRLREVFAAAEMLAETMQFAGVAEIQWASIPCWAEPLAGGNLIRLRLPMGNEAWERLTWPQKLARANRINRDSLLLKASVAADGIVECRCDIPVFSGITAGAVVEAAKLFIEQLRSASNFIAEDPEAISGERTTVLPKQVLRGIHWSFIGEPFLHRITFDHKVRLYQIEVSGEDTWRPNEVVIPCPLIRIVYMCWDGDEQIEPVVELISDDGMAFTASELLYKLHNAVVCQLREINHHFLEGLELHSSQSAGKPPLYVLHQGS
jgi:hypothetical protein